MREYLVSEIMQEVRIALDQNMTSEALEEIGDVDTLALNDIIKSKIAEAVEHVHSTAPVSRLDGFKELETEIHWGDMGSGWVELPEDMMRLVVFEMSDWSRCVFNALSGDDGAYLLQSSRFKGIRGTAERPLCVLSVRNGCRVLEFYSCKSENATISRGYYLPYPEIIEDDDVEKIEICERCYRDVVYQIATLVQKGIES